MSVFFGKVKLVNAQGKYPDNWTSDVVDTTGKYIARVSLFSNNGTQCLRIRAFSSHKILKEYKFAKGFNLSKDMLFKLVKNQFL